MTKNGHEKEHQREKKDKTMTKKGTLKWQKKITIKGRKGPKNEKEKTKKKKKKGQKRTKKDK